MASFVKYQQFAEDVYEKVHNLGADVLKLLLSNVAPNAAHAVKADVTEIAAGNGYSAGGPTVTITSSAQSSGTYKLVGTDVVVTASGGTIGPFRTTSLYNDTPTSPADPLIGAWDYGSGITLQIGETFTVDFDGTNGILQHA